MENEAMKQAAGDFEAPALKLPTTTNGLKRTITGLSLLAGFYIIIYLGVPTILLMSFLLQTKCFDEIIKIGYNVKKLQDQDIPLFRTLNWYFFVIANYFLMGEMLMQHCQVFINKCYIFSMLATYHRFVSYCLYFLGLISFTLILRKRIIRQQFSLLFWTHFFLIIISVQVYMFIKVLFEGHIWFIMSLWLVILNDIFAYVFGKRFGKTPLISVSPSKTVEGFVGGGLSTVVLGAGLSYIFCHFQYLVCPIKYVEVNNILSPWANCTPSYIFQAIPYEILNTGVFISYYPFLKHSLYMSLFASSIAPFGGFCASGFKRGVKLKDFSNFFPGHGGIMDRFDCQVLMMSFVKVYIITFVNQAEVEEIFQKILTLSEENQLEFFSLLKESLLDRIPEVNL